MPLAALLSWTAVAVGSPVGIALARLAGRMTGGGAVRGRALALALACPALAAWAQIAHPGAMGVLGALLAWQLLLLALLDAEQFWLPLPLTLTLTATGLVASAAIGPHALLAAAIGAVAGWAALTAVAVAYRRLRGREGLGGGDAWLLAGGGAWTGWSSLPTILVIAALGGLAAVGLLALMRRPVTGAQPLPFGVALALGIWLAWLYGPIGRG